MVPSKAPLEFPPLFDLERGRLLDLLRSLDEAQWHYPTPCPGWSVLGLSTHLLGNDLSLISRQRDDHHGTVAPAGLDEHEFIGWLDRLQVEWVHAARRLSPALTVELLEWTGHRTTSTIATRDPAAVDANVSWAGTRPVPRWLDQARELSEQWIHRQQILEAIGQPADLRADLAGPVLDALRWAYPHRLGAYRRPAGAQVEISIADHALGRHWILESDGRDWRFTPTVANDVIASIRMTADQAWRLLTNNHRKDTLDAIETSGDATIVTALTLTRAIIGEPK